MSIISIINAKIELLKKARKKELKRRYYEIRGEVIKFYEHKDIADGVAVNIPAFMRADRILKQVIKSARDINFYYGKLIEYKRVA